MGIITTSLEIPGRKTSWILALVLKVEVYGDQILSALNSCDWCGRVDGEVQSNGEAGSCFWCNNGLVLEVVIGLGKGGVGCRFVGRGIVWGQG